MPELITSLQNSRVKRALHLREARQRHKQGRFVIDGVRELSRALDARVSLLEVFVCREMCTSAERRAMLDRLTRFSMPLFEVTPSVYEKLCFGQRREGFLAVAATRRRTLEELVLPEENPWLLIIEGLEKPGNVGAILRSADGAGVSAVLVVDGGTDLFNPNIIRASLGTIFTLPVVETSSREALDWCRVAGFSLFAARVEATVDYTQADLSGKVALVLGSEAQGLSDVWRADDITAVHLPMLGTVDSLNVSTTAAVLCYEALRQRTRQ